MQENKDENGDPSNKIVDNTDDDKGKDDDDDHGDEVGDEDVVAGVAEISSEGRRAELGNQHLIIMLTFQN